MFRPQGIGGKGDAPRPTDWDKFSENFDSIFGKKEKKDDAATTTERKEKGTE